MGLSKSAREAKLQKGRVAKVVEIGGAGSEAWWSGSGGEVKVGG
jgi:hypothetical protein